jgi:hypothetical protein
MKKNIVILSIFACFVLVLAACSPGSKCHAYGYHTQNMELPAGEVQV